MKPNQKHSVFIVDDDADDRESIRDAFLENRHNQEYVFMKSGDQLIDHLASAPKSTKPVVILLDLNMPGKDGRDVLKEIKGNKDLCAIPVIVLTTSSSDKDREASYELGANCFVTKPDSYKELVSITDSIARLWFVHAS
jgi:CheY-like chemotaxis protein